MIYGIFSALLTCTQDHVEEEMHFTNCMYLSINEFFDIRYNINFFLLHTIYSELNYCDDNCECILDDVISSYKSI